MSITIRERVSYPVYKLRLPKNCSASEIRAKMFNYFEFSAKYFTIFDIVLFLFMLIVENIYCDKGQMCFVLKETIQKFPNYQFLVKT